MENSRILATTKYGEYKGNISVDGEFDKNPLTDFARDNGVNLEKYFPLSATYCSEKNNSRVEIIATAVASDYKGVEEYIKNHQKPLPVNLFIVDISLKDYLAYMKRFSFMITFQDSLIGQEINITKE